MILTEKKCLFCKTPLSPHQVVRGNVCDDISCQRQKAISDASIKQKQQELALRDRVNDLSREQLALEDQRCAVQVVLPSNDLSVAPLPDARRDKFRYHLEELVTQLMAQDDEPQTPPVASQKSLPNAIKHTRIYEFACRVCRGFCCMRGGGANAFLQVKTLKRYLRNSGTQDVHAIIDDYLSYIPTHSFPESCVYHGQYGCTLPSNMRADICGDFYCVELVRLHEKIDKADNPRVYAATTKQGIVIRTALFDEENFQTLS